ESEFQILPKPDDPNTVLPGTREVDVTLNWDPAQVGYSRLGLLVKTHADPDHWLVFGPRAPGETIRIATSWEMADEGHQHFSSWIFYLTYDYSNVTTVGNPTPSGTPAVNVKVTLLRGIVPLE